MIAYCTLSDAVNGMICLFAWNSPPKYSFNRCVVTVNVPFSGCVTSAPPCEKTLVTVKGPDHLNFNFPGKSFRRELNKRTCYVTPRNLSRSKLGKNNNDRNFYRHTL